MAWHGLFRRHPAWPGVLAALLIARALTAAAAASADGGTVVLDVAQVVASDAATFPPDVDAPRTRPLPDTWAHWRGSVATPVWYRLRFDAPVVADDDLAAVYIERVCAAYLLMLNGHVLHRAGLPGDAGAHLCNQPQLVSLPAALLRPTGNTLDLRVTGEALAQVASRLDSAGLSALVIGPRAALEARHARTGALQVAAPQAISATLALMGGFMFVLGWRHRAESHLAYFGALSVGWAVVEARRWWPGLPLATPVLEFLQAALLAVVALAAVQFLLRYVQVRHALVGRLLLLQCALMPATLVLAGPMRLHRMAFAWAVLFSVQIALAAVFHLQRRRAQAGGWPWPALALLACVGLGLLINLLARHWQLPGPLVNAAQLVVPAGLLVVGLRLVQLHGQALKASEATRASLETRVQAAAAEIENNFRQLAELRVEKVTERERKRIAADLHDDLGAKLLTIVHTSDDPRISTLAREALEEMRLSVRGLTGKPVRLDDALGDWRAELLGRLNQSGIESEWTAPDDLPQTLSARAYVQTTRILREATSNIIKHSRASRCTFSCGIDDGDLKLTIQDNGQGVPMELDGRLDRGHGMASMKHRAKQMQGQCLVESGPGHGTVIRLTLPLDHATASTP